MNRIFTSRGWRIAPFAPSSAVSGLIPAPLQTKTGPMDSCDDSLMAKHCSHRCGGRFSPSMCAAERTDSTAIRRVGLWCWSVPIPRPRSMSIQWARIQGSGMKSSNHRLEDTTIRGGTAFPDRPLNNPMNHDSRQSSLQLCPCRSPERRPRDQRGTRLIRPKM